MAGNYKISTKWLTYSHGFKFEIVDVCQFLQTLQSYQKRGWELVEVSLQLYLPLKLCTYELLRLISVFFYTFGLVCVYVRIKELHIWRYAGYNLHNLWIIHVHLLLNLGVKSGRPPPQAPKRVWWPLWQIWGVRGPGTNMRSIIFENGGFWCHGPPWLI